MDFIVHKGGATFRTPVGRYSPKKFTHSEFLKNICHIAKFAPHKIKGFLDFERPIEPLKHQNMSWL